MHFTGVTYVSGLYTEGEDGRRDGAGGARRAGRIRCGPYEG